MRKKTKPQPDAVLSRGLGGPAWRVHAAHRLPGKLTPQIARQLDPAVVEFREYLTLRETSFEDPAEAQAAFPLIAGAVAIDAQPALTEKLQCLVLAQLEPSEIAERLQLSTQWIEQWEKLFFDVRPALGARDWVALHVIDPRFKSGDSIVAARLQLAYCGGPAIGRALLDGDSLLPLDDAERLLGQKIRLGLKLREADAVPVRDSQHAVAILKLAHDLRRIELTEKQLAHTTLQATRKHELAVERLKLDTIRLSLAAAVQQDAQQRHAARDLERQAVANVAKNPLAQNPEGQSRTARQQQALAERIAHSPLAQLLWSQPAVQQPAVQQPAVQPAECIVRGEHVVVTPAIVAPLVQAHAFAAGAVEECYAPWQTADVETADVEAADFAIADLEIAVIETADEIYAETDEFALQEV